jgi:hypothetical protein
MSSYPRRTADLYASDTDRWSRPLNRVRAPPVSIRGVQKTCTPRLCLHPGRTGVLYATDADSRVPPLYVNSLFHCIMGLTYFLFFSFLSFFPFISCFHWESLHFMRIARYFMWAVIILCGSQKSDGVILCDLVCRNEAISDTRVAIGMARIAMEADFRFE